MSWEKTLNLSSAGGGLSRRRFLKTAAAGAVPCFVPGAALGLAEKVAANDRITVGMLGVGVRGADAPARGCS